MSPLEAGRHRYADRLMHGIGGDTQRLHAAFADTAREDFLGPSPWLLLGNEFRRDWCDDPAELYQDVLVALASNSASTTGSRRCMHAASRPATRSRATRCCTSVPASATTARSWRSWSARAGRVLAYEIEAAPRRARGGQSGAAAAGQRARHLGRRGAAAGRRRDLRERRRHASGARLARRDAHRCAADLSAHADDGGGCMLLVTRRSERGYAARASLRVSFIACIGARDARQSSRAAPGVRRALRTQHPVAAAARRRTRCQRVGRRPRLVAFERRSARIDRASRSRDSRTIARCWR